MGQRSTFVDRPKGVIGPPAGRFSFSPRLLRTFGRIELAGFLVRAFLSSSGMANIAEWQAGCPNGRRGSREKGVGRLVSKRHKKAPIYAVVRPFWNFVCVVVCCGWN